MTPASDVHPSRVRAYLAVTSNLGVPVIWHIVRFDLSSVDEATRTELEQQLAGLVHLDEVAWLTVARDLDAPEVTGLVTLFSSYEDLDAYRVHPQHVPVVERIRSLGIPVTRLDIDADLPPSTIS